MATAVTMSGVQFDALPYEEGRRWELLEGELIEVSSATPFHQDIVFAILSVLRRYLKENGVQGRAYEDVEFALSENLRLRPDVCVLLAERARQLDRKRVPIPGAPDLAIEIISPSERPGTAQSKVRAYIASGVSEVWQIYPDSCTVLIHSRGESYSLSAGQPVTSELLPGFSALVSSFFEEL